MDDPIPNNEKDESKVDYLNPSESGPGEATNFSAQAQKDKFLGGAAESSAQTPSQRNEPFTPRRGILQGSSNIPLDASDREKGLDMDQLIDKRNSWLDRSLNPDNSLPATQVILLDGNMQRCDKTLPPNPPLDGNSGSLYLRIPESENAVADMVYGQDPSLPGKLIVTDVSALPEFRGKGFGKRLYLEGLKALPASYSLVSHSMLSEDGERMWKWLVESGVARERNELVQGQIGKYETTF